MRNEPNESWKRSDGRLSLIAKENLRSKDDETKRRPSDRLRCRNKQRKWKSLKALQTRMTMPTSLPTKMTVTTMRTTLQTMMRSPRNLQSISPSRIVTATRMNLAVKLMMNMIINTINLIMEDIPLRESMTEGERNLNDINSQ